MRIMTTATMDPPSCEGPSAAMPEIDAELYDELQVFRFFWPNSEDALLASKEGQITCFGYDQAERRVAGTARVIVVVRHDRPDALPAARRVADECLRQGATSVWLWALSGYGVEYPTLRDWSARNSLIKHLGFARAADWEGFEPYLGSPQGVGPAFDGDPRPIAADLREVPGLDPLMIPAPLRDWCLDVANRVWCPMEYVAAPLIVALSGVIGRRVAIRPKRHDDWQVIPNLWGAIVGPPGSLKTPAIEEVLRPLKQLEVELMEKHRRDAQEQQGRAMVAAARKAAARKELDQAARDKAPEAALLALARKAQAQAEAEAQDEQVRRYFVNDVTVEKLGELLAQPVNANGLIIFRDELIGLFKTLDRPGHEADRSFFLEAWNGSGSFTFDRIGRGTVHIPHACLSIFGGIQPGPLASYLRRSSSGESCDGFTQRFQVMMYPDPMEEFVNIDRPPDQEARDRATALIRALDALDPQARGFLREGDRGIPFLRFDDEAQAFFDGWRVGLEERIRTAPLSAEMATHLSKYRSLMPSLALIFHLVEVGQGTTTGPVTHGAASLAAAWCDLLEQHAHRIYEATGQGDPEAAVRLSERLAALPNPFTCRQAA
jgi:putative DNA primase/helicase